jgi:signal transduction histidine kinase
MTAASQITPDLVAEARAGGEESYLPVQVQLVTLRTATGIDNASLIDSTRITLVDARAPEDAEGQPSALDTVAHAALGEALAGTPRVTTSFARGGRVLRAGLAPIFGAGGGVAGGGGAGTRVAGVIAVEAEPAYLVTLSGLSRTLWLIAALSLLGLAVLASLMVRTTVSAARLERRLSRSENLAAMGRLTATLAHEIKNPLAIIRGSAERLRSRDPEAERMAGFVIEETDRLSRTVARYLQFARGQDSLNERGDAIQALDATLDLLEGVPGASRTRRALARDGGFGYGPARFRVAQAGVPESGAERARGHARGWPVARHRPRAREPHRGRVRGRRSRHRARRAEEARQPVLHHQGGGDGARTLPRAAPAAGLGRRPHDPQRGGTRHHLHRAFAAAEGLTGCACWSSTTRFAMPS